MDRFDRHETRLDALARAVASGRLSRRQIVRAAGAAIASAALADPLTAFARTRRCKPGFKHCGPTKCCPPGFVCKTVHGKHARTTYSCACPTGKHLCGTHCTNTSTDPLNCGHCGHACGHGVPCVRGACKHPATCHDGIKNGGETDVDCGGAVCPKCANGKKCLHGTDCVSGHCDSGVCRQCGAASDCPQAPSGSCMNAVCTGGTCGFVVDDTNVPASTDCATGVCEGGVPQTANKQADTRCGTNNSMVCDGNGHCVGCLVASDCTPPSDPCMQVQCSQETCVTSAKPTTCTGNQLTQCGVTGPCPGNLNCNVSGTGCLGMCATSSDCVPGYYCTGGACVAQEVNGTTCTPGNNAQCVSGHCSPDGYCCNATCTGAAPGGCQTCSSGTCGNKPNGTPCTNGGTTCDGSGNCLM